MKKFAQDWNKDKQIKSRKAYREFVQFSMGEWLQITQHEWRTNKDLDAQDFVILFEECHEDFMGWVRSKGMALQILEFASARYVPGELVLRFVSFVSKKTVLARTIALAQAVLYWDVMEAIKEKYKEELRVPFKKS